MNAIRKACKGIGPALGLVLACSVVVGTLFWADDKTTVNVGNVPAMAQTAIAGNPDGEVLYNYMQTVKETDDHYAYEVCNQNLDYRGGVWYTDMGNGAIPIATSETEDSAIIAIDSELVEICRLND